jgi:hypothetical protein
MLGLLGGGVGCDADAGARAVAADGCEPALRAPDTRAYLSADGGGAATSTPADAVEGLRCSAPSKHAGAACAAAISGSYATAFDLDVWWQDEQSPRAPAFDPGRATLRVFARAELGDVCDGEQAKVSLRTCGVRLPPIAISTLDAVVQLGVPDAAWDRAGMASFTTEAHASWDGEGELRFDPVAALYGIELARADADWPSAADTPGFVCAAAQSGGDCFPDQDGDGHPGVTLEVQARGMPDTPAYSRCGAYRYAAMPTRPGEVFRDRGARALYAGLRLSLAGAQPIGASCDGGSAGMSAASLELRALDCRMDDDSPCTPAGAAYVDQHLPVFHVLAAGEAPPDSFSHPDPALDAALDRSASDGPRQTAVRLADLDADVACSDVRAAF